MCIFLVAVLIILNDNVRVQVKEYIKMTDVKRDFKLQIIFVDGFAFLFSPFLTGIATILFI